MERVIRKKVCPRCQGFGHLPECKCRNPVAFIMGCCTKCGGEGFVPARKEAPCLCDGKGCDLCGGRGTLPILDEDDLNGRR